MFGKCVFCYNVVWQKSSNSLSVTEVALQQMAEMGFTFFAEVQISLPFSEICTRGLKSWHDTGTTDASRTSEHHLLKIEAEPNFSSSLSLYISTQHIAMAPKSSTKGGKGVYLPRSTRSYAVGNMLGNSDSVDAASIHEQN